MDLIEFRIITNNDSSVFYIPTRNLTTGTYITRRINS